MSDSEDENYCFYGKALEPYDEESFPKKKPISVEEQIATDEQGRRRFHGAFTGGFSAGFFNTVGSLEGWKPTEFKSSRTEKAEKKVLLPEDYMDAEDTAEFGIAPQTVKATKDFSTTKKRKKQVFTDGPIPGEPVLHTLITSGNETVGYLLMKNMSLKHHIEQNAEEPKTYGCAMPRIYEIKRDTEDEICLIPDIYLQHLKEPKINTFGLGYVSLAKSHLNLFKSTQLVVHDKNKKLSISGQAFGVGAFEEDDEDIYAKDDMTNYDFELTAEAKSKKPVGKSGSKLEDFVCAKTPLLQPEKFALPIIPHSFSRKHNIKKSRFEPIVEPEVSQTRKKINAAVRAKYLGEVEAPSNKSTEKVKEEPEGNFGTTSNLLSEKFVSASQKGNYMTHSGESEAQDTNKSNEIEGTLASGLLVFGKFVSASQKENLHDILESVERSDTEHGTQEMRDAAKLNMFGPLTRVTVDWTPCSLLCKRFNIPEPNFDVVKKDTKRKNPIIFEYQKDKNTEPILQPGLFSSSAKSEDPGSTIQEPEKIVDEENLIVTEEEENKAQAQPVTVQEEIAIALPPPDPTEKINVSKNIDLFKAVFLSSSESESEDDKEREDEAQDRTDLIKTNVLSDHLLPKIKTNKQGILSGLEQITFNKNKIITTNTNNENDVNTIEENDAQKKNQDPNLYGPKLPEKIQPVKRDFVLPKVSHFDGKWVEKDAGANKRKTHKHKKKHKKEKHRKKEHKADRK